MGLAVAFVAYGRYNNSGRRRDRRAFAQNTLVARGVEFNPGAGRAALRASIWVLREPVRQSHSNSAVEGVRRRQGLHRRSPGPGAVSV
jgi:hypothetical protein